MRKATLVTISVAMLVLAAGTVCADINIFDEHMGVTLGLGSSQTDTLNGGTYTPFANNTFDPTNNTGTVDYVVDDWHGSWSFTNPSSNVSGSGAGQTPSGGEPYDVEAIYFDDTAEHLMIVIVTSFDPPAGRSETRVSGSPLIVSGDLAIDLGLGNSHHDDDSSVVDTFHYNYGVNINLEVRPVSGDATSGGTTIGTDIYETSNSDWYVASPTYAVAAEGEHTNFDPNWSGFGGTDVGDATVSYELWDSRMGGQECRYATYVIEILIPRSSLPHLEAGDSISLQWVEGCRNDAGTAVIQLDADIDMPEPCTLVLTGLGLMGMGWWKRRKRGKSSE